MCCVLCPMGSISSKFRLNNLLKLTLTLTLNVTCFLVVRKLGWRLMSHSEGKLVQACQKSPSMSFIFTPVLPSSSQDVLTGFRILFVDKFSQGLPLLSHPCLAGILLSTHFEGGSLSESQILSFKFQHCNFCCPVQYLQPCLLVQ